MKVKVKQKFRDKYTGDIRFMGEIVEMSEERYNEINAKKNGLRSIRKHQKRQKHQKKLRTSLPDLHSKR